MSSTESTKPDEVVTEDEPRARTIDVITDELNPSGADDAAAAEADKTGDNDQETEGSQKTDDSAKSDKKSRKRKRNSPAERRIRRLSRRANTAEADAERLARENHQLRQENAQLKQSGDKNKPGKEPVIDDYEDPKEYALDYAKWHDQANADTDDRGTTRTEPTPSQQQQPVASEAETTAFRDKGVEKLGDDFREALAISKRVTVPINHTMGTVILNHKQGHELYVYFARNRDIAMDIYGMPALKAEKAIDELAAGIEKHGFDYEPDSDYPDDDDDDDANGGDKKTGGKRQTSAPEPHPEGDRGTSRSELDLSQAQDMEEYAAMRRKQLKDQR